MVGNHCGSSACPVVNERFVKPSFRRLLSGVPSLPALAPAGTVGEGPWPTPSMQSGALGDFQGKLESVASMKKIISYLARMKYRFINKSKAHRRTRMVSVCIQKQFLP